MSLNIRLEYLHNGKEFSFPLDLSTEEARVKTNNILLWAKRESVRVSIKLNEVRASIPDGPMAEQLQGLARTLGRSTAA